MGNPEEELFTKRTAALNEFADAITERELQGLGIKSLAQFMIFLRAIAAMRPVGSWVWKFAAGVLAVVFLWDDIVARFGGMF